MAKRIDLTLDELLGLARNRVNGAQSTTVQNAAPQTAVSDQGVFQPTATDFMGFIKNSVQINPPKITSKQGSGASDDPDSYVAMGYSRDAARRLANKARRATNYNELVYPTTKKVNTGTRTMEAITGAVGARRNGKSDVTAKQFMDWRAENGYDQPTSYSFKRDTSARTRYTDDAIESAEKAARRASKDASDFYLQMQGKDQTDPTLSYDQEQYNRLLARANSAQAYADTLKGENYYARQESTARELESNATASSDWRKYAKITGDGLAKFGDEDRNVKVLYMNVGERLIFSYYYNKGDKKTAEQYFESISHILGQRAQGQIQQMAGEWVADDNAASRVKGGLLYALGVAAAPKYMGDVVKGLGKQIVTGDYVPADPNTPTGLLMESGDIGQEAILRGTSGTGRFVGETLLSVGTNVAQIALLGPAAPVLMSATAAGQGARESAKKGGSYAQATASGVAQGLAEYFGEKVAVGNLFKIMETSGKKGIKSFVKTLVKNMPKQAAAEFTEESATEAANILSDLAIMGSKSDVQQYLTEYLTNNPDAAKNDQLWAVLGYAFKRIGRAGAQGALSGLLMGAGGMLVSSDMAKSTETLLREQQERQAMERLGALMSGQVAQPTLLAEGENKSKSSLLDAVKTYAQRKQEGKPRDVSVQYTEQDDIAAVQSELKQVEAELEEVNADIINVRNEYQGTTPAERTAEMLSNVQRVTSQRDILQRRKAELEGFLTEDKASKKQAIEDDKKARSKADLVSFIESRVSGDRTLNEDDFDAIDSVYAEDKVNTTEARQALAKLESKQRILNRANDRLANPGEGASVDTINEARKRVVAAERQVTLAREAYTAAQGQLMDSVKKASQAKSVKKPELPRTVQEKRKAEQKRREAVEKQRVEAIRKKTKKLLNKKELETLKKREKTVRERARQSEVDYKDAKIDPKVKDFLDKIAEKLGVDVRISNYADFEGQFRSENGKGTIILSKKMLQSGTAAVYTAAHEVTHALEQTKLYSKLLKAVIRASNSQFLDVDARIAMLEDLYNESGKSADAAREWVAFYVQNYLFKSEDHVMDMLENDNPTAKGILKAIRTKYNATKGEESILERRQNKAMARVLSLWRRAMVRYQNGERVQAKTAIVKGGTRNLKINGYTQERVNKLPENKRIKLAEKQMQKIDEWETRNSYSINNAKLKAQMDNLGAVYGTFKKGVPKQVSADAKTRSFAASTMSLDSVEQRPQVQEGLVKQLIADGLSYIPIGNEKTIQDVLSQYEKFNPDERLDKMKTDWDSAVRNRQLPTLKQVVLGEQLLVDAIERNDVPAVEKYTAELAVVGTEAGRVVQAFSMIKTLSPYWQAHMMQTAVDRINDRNRQFIGGKYKDIVIPQNMLDKLNAARTPGEMATARNTIWKYIAENTPATLGEKIRGWRYFAMLANPKTHIRNIGGNAIMKGARTIKDLIATAIEAGAEKGGAITQNQRTKTLYLKARNKDVVDYAKREFLKQQEAIMSSGGLAPAFFDRYKPIFRGVGKSEKSFGGFLDKMIKGAFKALDAEDVVFLRDAFTDSYAKFMVARKYTPQFMDGNTPEGLRAREEARQYAMDQALKATFRDASALADTLNRLERKSTLAQVLIGGTMPFKKTPWNILKRGIEYSPVGLVVGTFKGYSDFKRDMRSSDKTIRDMAAAKWIDKISAGLTGTAITALGYFLAAAGIVSVSDDDEQAKATFDRDIGVQRYSINIMGYSYTIDWMTPVNMPLLVGAEIRKQMQGEGSGNAVGDIYNGIVSLGDPILQLSMLQSLTDVMGSAFGQTDSERVGAAVQNAAANYVSQFIPSVLASVARSVDPTRRTTYAPKDSPYTKQGEQFYRKLLNKIPGLSKTLEPYVDLEGNTQVDDNNGLQRTLFNLFSPGYIAKAKTDEKITETLRLYDATGETAVLPQAPDSYIVLDGTRYDMKPGEYTAFKVTTGKETAAATLNLISTDYYKKASDEDKVELIKDAKEYARVMAKIEFFEKRDVEYKVADSQKWTLTAKAAKDAGMSVGQYISLRNELNTDAIKLNDIDPKTGEGIDGTAFKKKVDLIESYKPNDAVRDILLSSIAEKERIEYYEKNIKASGMGVGDYIKTYSELSLIKGDPDGKGGSIDNTSTAKKIQYIKKSGYDGKIQEALYKSLFTGTSNKRNRWSEVRAISDYNTLVDYLSLPEEDFMVIKNVSQADYAQAKQYGIDATQFIEYANYMDAQKSEYDPNGKEIKGKGRKDKIYAYVYYLPISKEAKEYLFYGMMYPKDTKKQYKFK